MVLTVCAQTPVAPCSVPRGRGASRGSVESGGCQGRLVLMGRRARKARRVMGDFRASRAVRVVMAGLERSVWWVPRARRGTQVLWDLRGWQESRDHQGNQEHQGLAFQGSRVILVDPQVQREKRAAQELLDLADLLGHPDHAVSWDPKETRVSRASRALLCPWGCSALRGSLGSLDPGGSPGYLARMECRTDPAL